MQDAAFDEMFRLEDEHWWFVGKRLIVLSLLGGLLERPGLRVLDVGCGTGGVLQGLVAGAFGVDSAPQALSYCRRRGLRRLACAAADRLPFATGSFDLVLLLDVLEHFADEDALLRSVRAAMVPGGTLLVSVPAFPVLWTQHDEVLHHVRRYRAGTLRQALDRAGFEVRRLTYTNVAPFPPALVVRGVLQRLGVARREGTDFRVHAPWVNRTLIAAYRLEASLLRRRVRFPVGLSVAGLATAPAREQPDPADTGPHERRAARHAPGT